jgi:DNA polymerase III delta subunit
VKLTSSVVILGGEEHFLIDRDAEYFRKFAGYEVRSYDGEEGEAEFLATSQSPSIDFETLTLEKSVLILTNAQDASEKALRARFEGYDGWSDLTRFHVLVYYGKVPSFWSKHKTQVRVHEKLKSFASNNEVLDWLHSEVKSVGVKLSPELVRAMYSVVGPDLYRLASEVRKLNLYLQGKEGTAADLKVILTPGSPLASWDISESVMLRDLKGALNRLSRVYRYASEDPSLMILGSLVKSVEKTLVAKSLASRGLPPEEVATALGMHPFRYKTAMAAQVERNSLESLTHALQVLATLDFELKRTPYRRTALELAIHKLLT